jgi:hypothetical protein
MSVPPNTSDSESSPSSAPEDADPPPSGAARSTSDRVQLEVDILRDTLRNEDAASEEN